jgi:hypothetical protein
LSRHNIENLEWVGRFTGIFKGNLPKSARSQEIMTTGRTERGFGMSGPEHPVQNSSKDIRTGCCIKNQFAINIDGGYRGQAAVYLAEFIKTQCPLFFGDDDFLPCECIPVIRRYLGHHQRHIHTGNAMLAFVNHFDMNGFHVLGPNLGQKG